MALPFRPYLVLLLLLGILLPTTNGLAQPLPGGQAPQPPKQPYSITQLRDLFITGCMAKGKDPQQRSYCGCVFNALLRRYNQQQYVSMDNLIVGGGPEVSQFASLAWSPEFNACRLSSARQER